MKKIILLFTLMYASVCISNAQPGKLDPTFGNNGLVIKDIGTPLKLQGDGEEILADANGNIYLVIQYDFLTTIAKKLPSGVPDSSYGLNGYSTTIRIFTGRVHAVMQTDGKIVVAGSGEHKGGNTSEEADFALARFTPNGVLDTSFAGTGIKIYDIGYDDLVYSMALQADGKIILVGTTDSFAGPNQPQLVRFNNDGSVDLQRSSVFSDKILNIVAVQPDGKILVGGDTYLYRFLPDFTPDPGFSEDGKMMPSFHITAIGVPNDNTKFYAGGSSASGLFRFLSTGVPDSSFGGDGQVASQFGIGSIKIQNDGKVVTAGTKSNGSNFDFIVARYNVNGTPDNIFDADGIVVTDFGESKDLLNAVALSANGKILVFGSTQKPGDGPPAAIYPAVARYNGNGTPDNSFNGNGKLSDQTQFGNSSFNATAVQSDKKIVVAGTTWNGSNFDFLVARFNTDGKPDTSFSGDGYQVRNFSNRNDEAYAINILPDGKILVGGTSNGRKAMVKFNADGTPDNSFNGNARNAIGTITEIISFPDGKFLANDTSVVRYLANGSVDQSFNTINRFTTDFAVNAGGKILLVSGDSMYRYNNDGTPDNTFAQGHGVFSGTSVGCPSISISDIAIQSDGKIVLVGSGQQCGEQITSFFISRYTADGKPDDDFQGGTIYTRVNEFSRGSSLKIQDDHKILLAGETSNGTFHEFSILRFKENGTLDSTFNHTGIQNTPVLSRDATIQALAISGDRVFAAGKAQLPGSLGVLASYQIDGVAPTPPSISLTAPANNATYLSGGNVYLKAAASDADGRVSKVDFYMDGSLIYSTPDTPYTYKQAKVHSGKHVFYAKATDNSGLVTVSDTVHISVVPNTPPTVNIINPANGAVFLKGATLHLQAAASDPDGRVTRVEFYNGNTLLTTEHKVPYNFDWKANKTGSYNLTAKAFDNWGAETTSGVINITVVPNQSPSVSITNPVNGATFATGVTIALSAVASDPDGRVGRVDFYEGNSLLASELKVPYTYQWTNAAVGEHTITAVATDNWGAHSTSSPVTITVLPEMSVFARQNTPADISGISNTISIRVLPNPVAGVLNICGTGFDNNKPATLSIVSASGVVVKTLRSKNVQNNQLDVSSLPAGVYVIKMESGQKVVYKQFVKK